MTTVEHGRTRCPRCAAFAEYRFLEVGKTELKYEVCCGTCGHVHSEVTLLTASPATAA
ncbi:hypothetical protein [Mycobacterium triplex]|uniref:Uncharacterized protein n=1 Tax=Mycobacterium triplex TaxID=47839 RepID=A0A024JRH3_9MYCO|nr:hypothetical protein [Mycobacterium triplex]CDO86191.1 hypothetical protein BN973_00532 [Mycobacterium triplex]